MQGGEGGVVVYSVWGLGWRLAAERELCIEMRRDLAFEVETEVDAEVSAIPDGSCRVS
jgi:hypothetical protein